MNVAARLAIPRAKLSVSSADNWSLQSVSDDTAEIHGDGLGSFLVHAPTGICLNIRCLPFEKPSASNSLSETFEKYANVSWPDASRTTAFWHYGNLRGISATFKGAMPGCTVGEWIVTDGEHFANAATFASVEQWGTVAQTCESLLRTIRFSSSDG